MLDLHLIEKGMTMEEQGYNGWTNRETWATALHIDNDQALLEIALDYARQEIEGHDEGEEINNYYLSETLEIWIVDHLFTIKNVTDNYPLWLMLTDIGSLYRVNWRELADHYLNQAREGVTA